jgi:hypothetical protein
LSSSGLGSRANPPVRPHQLLGDTDDSFPVWHGPDLAQGFGVEREALDHVLAVVGLPQCRGVSALRVFAEER